MSVIEYLWERIVNFEGLFFYVFWVVLYIIIMRIIVCFF